MVIGLTGGSGTGKSSVSKFFENKGFLIIDMDKISRKVCQKDTPCLKEVTKNFGDDILNVCKELNRQKLGNIVFSDEEKLKLLNRITHKYIIEETNKIISENSGKNIVLDAPLLFETGLDSYCDMVVGILCKKETRAQRIVSRDGISYAQAMARINSQPNDEFYIKRCSVVLHNDSDIDALNVDLEKKFGGCNE